MLLVYCPPILHAMYRNISKMADQSLPINPRMHYVVFTVTSSGCLKLYQSIAIAQYVVSCKKYAVFVNQLLIVCWNLHMTGDDLFNFSKLFLSLRYMWTEKVGCYCIIVIKHGLPVFCDIRVCIDNGPKLDCDKWFSFWHQKITIYHWSKHAE